MLMTLRNLKELLCTLRDSKELKIGLKNNVIRVRYRLDLFRLAYFKYFI